MKKFLVAILAAITCISFAACAPSNVEKAKDKLKDAGYTIVTASEEAVPYVEGSVGSITAVKGGNTLAETFTGGGEALTAVLFESKSAAKDYYEDAKGEAEEDDDEIIELKGKWIIVGSEDAIKDFTK